MLAIIFSLLVCDLGLGAPLPAPSVDPLAPANEIHFNTNYRSTPQIIWTCIITTFLCTWVSIHPNIVGYKSTWSRRFTGRLGMFTVAFAVPEFLLLKAMVEWEQAIYIADRMSNREGLARYMAGTIRHAFAAILWESLAEKLGLERKKDGQWETAHGHFLLMGGVIFRVDGKLRYLELGKLLHEEVGTEEPYIAARKELESLPRREVEIHDRSKGDIITKGITFVQTIWFIVHLGVRRLQNLEVTALEILTLSYAVVSVFVCICWWEKPFNVYNPIIIDLNVTMEPGTQGSPHSGGTEGPGLRSSPPESPALNEVPAQGADEYIESISTGASLLDDGTVQRLTRTCAFLVILALSGGVYFIAWNMAFPSPVGRILWRIFSLLALSLLPVTTFVVSVAALLKFVFRLSPSFTDSAGVASLVFMSFIYMGARLVLVSLALWSLRDLSPTAHQTVAWSQYIPHI